MLRDVPHGDVGVQVARRQRRWRCTEGTCPRCSFSEQVAVLVAIRGVLTRRAVACRSDGCAASTPRSLGSPAGSGSGGCPCGARSSLSWNAWPQTQRGSRASPRRVSTSTRSQPPHHGNVGERGSKEPTGMIDLTGDSRGRTQARLLDLVPGRSKKGPDPGSWTR